ncbi:hypothetical protein WISP_78183 [Willisornis vidua]|uniref:Uncharacterized protein n=1 Tax=Willisornis vidua TaxID=1566151 RepID=A0ABQ9DA99_9PASS|nr:hypothetical protein WISP_109309 [Willisornis vidua]KAJ7415490.1 hypothetical protein WISP_78183 [Willisornis vidua]
MGCQLFQEYTMRDGVKDVAEVQIDHIHSLPLIYQADQLVIKRDQVLCDGTQDDLLHNLARHRGQTDRPAVSQIFLLALFVDKRHIHQPPIIQDLPKEPGLLINDGEQCGEIFRLHPQHLGVP